MRDIRIAFVGESFINGTGDTTFLGWTGRLCATLAQQGHAVTYYNLGIRRETSAELVCRWHTEVTRRLPPGCENHLVFSFGTNDTTIENGQQRVELADSLHNARQILSTARSQYPVLMISPPPIADMEQNDRTQILSTHFATLCQELTIPYLDVFTPLLASTVWLTEVEAGDGAHPDAAGYTVFAQLVQQWPGWVEAFAH